LFRIFPQNFNRGNAATNNTPNEGKKIIEEKSRKSKRFNMKNHDAEEFFSYTKMTTEAFDYIRCDQLRNKSSRRVTYGNPCYSIGSKANSIYFLNDRSVFSDTCE
jgi:hypothetical protein